MELLECQRRWRPVSSVASAQRVGACGVVFFVVLSVVLALLLDWATQVRLLSLHRSSVREQHDCFSLFQHRPHTKRG
jgi:hypothetical protein